MISAPKSPNLRLHGDSQLVVQVGMFALGVAFWVAGTVMDRPVMDELAYGDVITRYHAEWWAVSILVASTVYLLGIIINGDWRHSPLLRIAGATWHVLTLSAFAWGGWHAPSGMHLAIFTTDLVAVHLLFLWWNVTDYLRARTVE